MRLSAELSSRSWRSSSRALRQHWKPSCSLLDIFSTRWSSQLTKMKTTLKCSTALLLVVVLLKCTRESRACRTAKATSETAVAGATANLILRTTTTTTTGKFYLCTTKRRKHMSRPVLAAIPLEKLPKLGKCHLRNGTGSSAELQNLETLSLSDLTTTPKIALLFLLPPSFPGICLLNHHILPHFPL